MACVAVTFLTRTPPSKFSAVFLSELCSYSLWRYRSCFQLVFSLTCNFLALGISRLEVLRRVVSMKRFPNTLFRATLILTDFSRRSFPAYRSFSPSFSRFSRLWLVAREQIGRFRNVGNDIAAVLSHKKQFDSESVTLEGLASGSSCRLSKHLWSYVSCTMQQLVSSGNHVSEES